MDLLKKFWPSAFKVAEKDVKDLIIKIVIYVIGSLIAGFVLGLIGIITGWIPVLGLLIGLVLGLVGGIVELYCLVGIVLVVLKFLGIVK